MPGKDWSQEVDVVWQAKRARVGIGSARNVTERHGRQGMSRPGGEG